MDEDELEELLEPLIEAHGITEENFSLAYYYTGTDEAFFMNADVFFYPASMYKVPLCMVYAERISKGEFSGESRVGGAALETLLRSSLVSSNNDAARMLVNGLGGNRLALQAMSAYSGTAAEDQPADYYKFQFTARFMLETMLTLYREPERFPGIIDYLKLAQPEQYFHETLGHEYEIAQKYGQMDGKLHTAGIIYTPNPIILVLMCSRVPQQYELIGEAAELLTNYSLELDERLATQQAALASEQLVLEQQQEALREAEQQTSAPSPETAAEEAPAQTRAESVPFPALPVLLLSGAALGVALWLLSRRRKRKTTTDK